MRGDSGKIEGKCCGLGRPEPMIKFSGEAGADKVQDGLGFIGEIGEVMRSPSLNCIIAGLPREWTRYPSSLCHRGDDAFLDCGDTDRRRGPLRRRMKWESEKVLSLLIGDKKKEWILFRNLRRLIG